MGFFDALGSVGSALGGIGSVVGGITGASSAKKNLEQQKEYAQNSIQWRVNDAKKAGIHPVFALGASASQFQPFDMGNDYGLSGMGQAMSNIASQNDNSMVEFQNESNRLTLQGQELENQMKALEIEQKWKELKNMGQNPAFKGLNPFGVSPTSAPGGIVGASQIEGQNSVNVRLGYGFDSPIPAYSFSPRPDGSIEILPSKDRMDWASESMPLAGLFEAFRQGIDASNIAEHLTRYYKRPVYYRHSIFGPKFSFKERFADKTHRPIYDFKLKKFFWSD